MIKKEIFNKIISCTVEIASLYFNPTGVTRKSVLYYLFPIGKKNYICLMELIVPNLAETRISYKASSSFFTIVVLSCYSASEGYIDVFKVISLDKRRSITYDKLFSKFLQDVLNLSISNRARIT